MSDTRTERGAVTVVRWTVTFALCGALLFAAAAQGQPRRAVTLVPSHVFDAGSAWIDTFAAARGVAAVWTSQQPIGTVALKSGPCGGAKIWDGSTGEVHRILSSVPCQDLAGVYLGVDATKIAVLATYAPPMSADEVDDLLWIAGWRPPTRRIRVDATTTTSTGGIHSFAVRGGILVHDRWNEPELGGEAPIGLYRGKMRIGGHTTGHILSFDGARLLVRTTKGEIVLLGLDGRRLKTFGVADTAELDGDTVVSYAKRTLSVWSVSRGTVLRHWHVPAARGTYVPDDPAFLSQYEATVDLSVGGGYAAYFPRAASRQNFPSPWHGPIWLVRLSDGRTRRVVIGNLDAPSTVRLDATGLYARSEHTVAFVPRARVAASFR